MRWFVFSAVILFVSQSYASIIVDGGFEATEPTDGPWPTVTGVWGGDGVTSVTAENGIVPIEGSRMARFDSTNQGSPGGFIASLVQLLDMSPFVSQINTGNAQLVITAAFNRVGGDAQTDTEFHVAARAFDSSPSGFGIDPFDTYEFVSFLSDSDIATWEERTLTFDVPIGTTFVAIDFRAIENIDESDSPEFDGHYVDAVHVELVAPVPEPTTFTIFLFGIIGLVACWRKRRNYRYE